MAVADLREWIGSLEEKGELKRIRAEVDWDEEIGAITREISSRSGPARQLALRYTDYTGKYPLGTMVALNRAGTRVSTRKGGTLIEYEDEDPQIRLDYEAALRNEGIAVQMPRVVSR